LLENWQIFKNKQHFPKGMEYEEMLKRAREKLPEVVLTKERFEIPKVKGHLEGNKTVISNFLQIASIFNRDTDHFLKYILKELAAPGKVANNILIIGTKVSSGIINEKIQAYAEEFVLCKSCGKPDTKLEKEEGFLYLKCAACGSRYPVKSKI
jgi:translation initiation factor 2 subunit 2